eukprot:TRINITY_DN9634_c0_g1_i2.p1 TRINITY_DN9634_c0_g1~~TRINITY_DN9634_c0_g1_i2.p1  ORF type:complete len:352 (-),score=104.22 TRINITY_DN9634_c0_g1_i2:14-1069(-)
MTSLQLGLYKSFLNTMQSSLFECALPAITSLKKLCNHPCLVYDESTKSDNGFRKANDEFPEDFDIEDYTPELSGKLMVLDQMLKQIRKKTQDKVVLVSNSTKMLDVFAIMCKKMEYDYLRLDGSTQTDQRQKLVDRFNSKDDKTFLFLLSTKAGGVGLNLIGACRLVLFDSDWNPAHDKQAMARVWRDGQKKPVYIYRLLSTGSLEEKIFQRQLTKEGLSGSIVDGKKDKSNSFTKEELKDIFTLNEDTLSDTHDLLDCQDCSGTAKPTKTTKRLTKQSTKAQALASTAVSQFTHASSADSYTDWVLENIAQEEDCPITFVFSKTSTAEDKEQEDNELDKELDALDDMSDD